MMASLNALHVKITLSADFKALAAYKAFMEQIIAEHGADPWGTDEHTAEVAAEVLRRYPTEKVVR